MSQTYQPKKARRKRRHGFLGRMERAKSEGSGSHVIANRRRKRRKRVSV